MANRLFPNLTPRNGGKISTSLCVSVQFKCSLCVCLREREEKRVQLPTEPQQLQCCRSQVSVSSSSSTSYPSTPSKTTLLNPFVWNWGRVCAMKMGLLPLYKYPFIPFDIRQIRTKTNIKISMVRLGLRVRILC